MRDRLWVLLPSLALALMASDARAHAVAEGDKGYLQAYATLPENFIAFELPTASHDWWWDIVDGLPDPLVQNSLIEVWDRPGMGVELNSERTKPHLKEEDAGFFD